MKRFNLFVIVLIIVSACDNYLDVVPDNIATLDYAFRDKISAEKYLATCYYYLPYFGSPSVDHTIMASDEMWAHEDSWYYQFVGGNYNIFNIQKGYQNISEPLCDYFSGANGPNLWQGIRDCNIFIENINNVPDMLEGERNRWKAEVKFLKAYYHYYLMKLYGPIPIIRENLSIAAGIDEVRVFREPFDECVNYVVRLIDEAIPDLPMEITNMTTEYGRITKSIALSVKAEVLVTAASSLFNGNGDYSDFVDSRGVNLFSLGYDESKWKRAMDACKNAIDTTLLAGHRLYEFSNQKYSLSDTTKLVMALQSVYAERDNPEVIWRETRVTTRNLQHMSIPFFTSTDIQYWRTCPVFAPTMRMAELFYTQNGVPISEDKDYDYANRYKTKAASVGQKYYIQNGFETAILNQHREARFYANLGFDGGLWFGNGRYKDVGQGTASEQPWVLKMKRGEVTGKNSSMRFSITGYYSKKWGHYETQNSSTGALTVISFGAPIIRLADLYLLYAEARNEYSGPDAEVYEYVDRVRQRAGLNGVVESWSEYSKYPDKPSTKEGLRAIIQQERMIELAFEGKRFWDIRRWKTAGELLNKPVKGWNIEGSTTDSYYNVTTIWPMEFSTKEYLWPIKETTLRNNPNLIQNPYW